MDEKNLQHDEQNSPEQEDVTSTLGSATPEVPTDQDTTDQATSKPKPGFFSQPISRSFFIGFALTAVIGGFSVLIPSPAYHCRPRELAHATICASNMSSIGKSIAICTGENKNHSPSDFYAMIETGPPRGLFKCPSLFREEKCNPTYDSAGKYLKDMDYIYTLRGMEIEKLLPEMLMLYELPDKHCNTLLAGCFVRQQCDSDSFRKKIQECNDFLANKRGVQK